MTTHSNINAMPIQHFTQILKSAELSNAKEVKLSMQQARLLHITLTELLDQSNKTYHDILANINISKPQEPLNLDGGNFSVLAR